MGFSLFFVETNEVRSARETSRRIGFVSDFAGGPKARHYIGRQAPVKRCLARLQGLRPAVLRLNSENKLRIALRCSAKI
jgi:hypothetical protein